MFKLIVVTLAAFVAVLQIFGDPARRPVEVARAAPERLSLAAFVGVAETIEEVRVAPALSVSDSEAVAMAMAASRAVREGRLAKPARNRDAEAVELAAAVEEVVEVAATDAVYWYVSGSRVNLRQGPGTGTAVVAQVTEGTEALVLDARDGWMQIQTRDGATSGWIFGKFLNERKPG